MVSGTTGGSSTSDDGLVAKSHALLICRSAYGRFCRKSPKYMSSENQLNSNQDLQSTFFGMAIPFRATYVALTLGHEIPRVLFLKTFPRRQKN